MECSCEHGNEPSGSMQLGDLFDWLRSCQIADDCAVLTWSASVTVTHLLTETIDGCFWIS